MGGQYFGKATLNKGEEILPMKKKFSVEQIVAVLKQAEVGVPVAELIRKVGISKQTFHRWKKQCVGLESDQSGSTFSSHLTTVAHSEVSNRKL
jgi:transposase-like protein